MRSNYKWLWISVLVVFLDLLSKSMALKYLLPYQAKPIVPCFNLTLAFNYGAAFSFLNNGPGWQNVFFISVAVVISAVLLYWVYKAKQNELLSVIAMCFILGGAWGNVFDRLYYGYVIDFIELYVGKYSWPIFNLADSAICLGAGLMLVTTFLESRTTLRID